MRYAIISKGIALSQLEKEIIRVGAKNIIKTQIVGQIFCDLDESGARTLALVPGLVVKEVKAFKTTQTAVVMEPVETISDVFYLLRSYFNPPLTGVGLTVAVLDSGIRKTHQSLRSKIVYEANYSSSPTPDDIFGHGTQVAFVIAGGMQAAGEKAGVSPGAVLFNIKVINDAGIGAMKLLCWELNKVCHLAEQARTQAFNTDDVSTSLFKFRRGRERRSRNRSLPCRQASQDTAGCSGSRNSGPKMTTIMLPACDPEVIAVGAIETTGELAIWENSSRGPTVQGETKPDFVLWGTNLEMASHKADTEYLTKSGTSFAAPMLSGLTGLLWESGRRAYGEGWQFRWAAAKQYAPYYSTKPQEAPLNKDNAYGYGLPAMGSMLGQVAQVNTAPAGSEMFPMMMLMSLMAGLMGGG